MGLTLKVAVIGAGLAGLVAARELKREGHQVTVFEKADQLGGTWVYNPQVESGLLSHEKTSKTVHSSLYFSLRTNLPRQIMGFSDYPFKVQENGDQRNFPGHEEVLRFLNDFANEFGIVELIRFKTEVLHVEPADLERGEWIVECRTGEDQFVSEFFEAVVVCNGHYTVPHADHLPGIEQWPGKQVHSHNYREPTPYQNQVVVVIGSGPSATDISAEIANVAKEVHLSSRSPDIIKVSKLETHHNIWQHSKVMKVCEDGKIQFGDGSTVLADTILHCTGYNYSFPFLKKMEALRIDDRRVGPLYKHVFPPSLAPRLSFVGIPLRAITTILFELQAKWIASILSGKLQLPSEEEMLADVEQYYQYMQVSGIPKHHTHIIDMSEFQHQNWLAAQLGVPQLDEGLMALYKQTIVNSESKRGFRDALFHEKLRTQANLGVCGFIP